MNKITFLRRIAIPLAILTLIVLGCRVTSGLSPTPTAAPTATFTPLPSIPVVPGAENPQEPVYITGSLQYTSPFFEENLAEPFVLLEDQAGFVRRDSDFEFKPVSQATGPVQVNPEEDRLTYSLALPAVPQGTLVDVDNNGEKNTGVQVFAISYWLNTWGDLFIEPRDGTGWTGAYGSTRVDPKKDFEIQGGVLIVWAPDDMQAFPSGFGNDGLLFTSDDPTAPIPAGYNLVNLDESPFRVYKEAQPTIDLIEGEIAINDFSGLSYSAAFEALYRKISREYPFTKEKGIDWEALYREFAPQIQEAQDKESFFRALRDFAHQIPDGHVFLFDRDVFFEDYGGGLGLVLTELSDGRLIASQVLPGYPAEAAGIEPGAEIIQWNGQPVDQAIAGVQPGLGSSSTEHHRRQRQVAFLTRLPSGSRVIVTYRNPGESEIKEARMSAELEVESFIASIPPLSQDELSLPIEARILQPSGLGYIRINSFNDDKNLMARLWDRHLQKLIDSEIRGLIIDLRVNGGGDPNLARDFAGYFFDDEIELYQGLYYNDATGKFEAQGESLKSIEPGPTYFEGPLAVLVGPDCVSACEGFAYAMSQEGRATIIGHYPTAGAFGEVGRGQYKLPEDIEFQIPTGRAETPSGKLLIEGRGVVPDVTVPVTAESAIGEVDAVLESAIQVILDKLR